jgi:hypothetical protein
MFDLHRLLGWGLVALFPWKAAISLRSLRRGLKADFDRGVMVAVSLLLAALALLVVGLGLGWLWRLGSGEAWLRQTLISWHWMLGLALMAPLALHAWRRWPRPRRTDFISRRAALRLLRVGAAVFGSWWLAQALAGLRALTGSDRRFTGSRLDGLDSANRFPITNGPGEGQEPVDVQVWRLEIELPGGKPRYLSYAELLDLPQAELVADLDCTLGWYSTQAWQGVWLADLIADGEMPSAVLGVQLVAVTGYAHLLPWQEARQVLLATHVGGEPLDHWHGYPVRAVVPSRRGWYWVKWLGKVRVLASG